MIQDLSIFSVGRGGGIFIGIALTKQRCPRGYMEERDPKNRANFLPEIECDSAKPSVHSRKDIYPTGLKNCLQ